MAELLFVAGVARSGTTALRAVLGTHPDLAIGMERFKRLWGADIGRITPELFERERFFDFSDGFTNITPELDWAQERLAALDAKWDTARYRGDKMTVIRAQRLWETFPDARFVFIVRDLAQVASSWARRAADASDTSWRADADATRSVAAWNTAVRRVARAVSDRPSQAMVVEYTRFFGDPAARLAARDHGVPRAAQQRRSSRSGRRPTAPTSTRSPAVTARCRRRSRRSLRSAGMLRPGRGWWSSRGSASVPEEARQGRLEGPASLVVGTSGLVLRAR